MTRKVKQIVRRLRELSVPDAEIKALLIQARHALEYELCELTKRERYAPGVYQSAIRHWVKSGKPELRLSGVQSYQQVRTMRNAARKIGVAISSEDRSRIDGTAIFRRVSLQ